ncbi:hypothetical protein GIB67_002911, partial [Kingdonia uniflora]
VVRTTWRLYIYHYPFSLLTFLFHSLSLSSPNRILSSPCSPNLTRFFTVIFAVSLELLLLEGVEATVTDQLLLPLWLIYFSHCRFCCCCFEV